MFYITLLYKNYFVKRTDVVKRDFYATDTQKVMLDGQL